MLYVGASPTNQSAALTGQVLVSDGNLHIDPAVGTNLFFGYFQARDIYLNPHGGKVGIGTITPSATLDVRGFTKLGDLAPSIKMRQFTGTTAANEGDEVSFYHGLDPSKFFLSR